MSFPVILILLFLGTSCGHNTHNEGPKRQIAELQEFSKNYSQDHLNLINRIKSFQMDTEKYLTWRMDNLKEVLNLISKLEMGKKLTPESLDAIQNANNRFNDLLTNVSKNTKQGLWLLSKEITFSESPTHIGLDSKALINPKDDDGKMHIKNIYRSIASSSLALDSFLVLKSHFLMLDKLKDIISYDDAPFFKLKESFHSNFEQKINLENLAKAMITFLNLQSKNKESSRKIDRIEAYLEKMIKSSFVFKQVWKQIERNDVSISKIKKQFEIKLQSFNINHVNHFLFSITNYEALNIEKERSNKKVPLSIIIKELQPGDIVLSKNINSPTYELFGGAFNEMMMYTGSISQLKELGVATHPLVNNFSSILKDGSIVRIGKDGAKLKSLQELNDKECIVILRSKTPIESKKILKLFTLINRPYDYSFKFYDSSSLAGNELIVSTFEELDWNYNPKDQLYSFSSKPITDKIDSGHFNVINIISKGHVVDQDQIKLFLNSKNDYLTSHPGSSF